MTNRETLANYRYENICSPEAHKAVIKMVNEKENVDGRHLLEPCHPPEDSNHHRIHISSQYYQKYGIYPHSNLFQCPFSLRGPRDIYNESQGQG